MNQNFRNIRCGLNESCSFRWQKYDDTDILFMTIGKDMKEPYTVSLETDLPIHSMTALYMLNDWWTRPAFIKSFKEMPARTQLLMIETQDLSYCILPLACGNYKVQIIPSKDECLSLSVFSNTDLHEETDQPLFIIASDSSVRLAVEKAMKAMAHYLDLPLKDERPYPEMLKYLGWCSWDAFYRDVNAQGLKDKAAELVHKEIPVRWMLIDDGWLSTEGMKLTAFEPDQKKFPGSFHPVINEIRNQSMIEWFGVWHAVCGFWEGIAKDNRLECDDVLYDTQDGNLYPSPYNGEAFYRKWYEYLNKEGIDFVKVDGQSTVANFFKNHIPAPAAAKGISRAIENAAELMNHNVINCMGMAMESIAARTKTAVSRNSDDFVPSRGTAGFREHLLQNAFNSLYHNILYACDWDMFWTKEEDAEKHAILRSLSGGPVYFSDRVDESCSDVFKAMTYQNGRIPMMKRSLMPSDDCVFNDPLQSGILKLHNYAETAGVNTGGFLLFNLTDSEQTCTVSPDEIKELDSSRKYVVYDWMKEEILTSAEMNLKKDEYRWIIFAPRRKHMAFLGRSDLYAGIASVCKWNESNTCDSLILEETGPFSWYSENDVKKITVNGNDCTHLIQKKDHLYHIDLDVNEGIAVIGIEWV